MDTPTNGDLRSDLVALNTQVVRAISEGRRFNTWLVQRLEHIETRDDTRLASIDDRLDHLVTRFDRYDQHTHDVARHAVSTVKQSGIAGALAVVILAAWEAVRQILVRG